ncbi:hypothetical protein MUCCIDRAFT_116386, partial [Mucor lusitanicus CBS 277.49]
PPPPLPLARYDQSTVTGSSEPLVDEIAACVSEWNSLLYTFISQRQYTTFNTVRDHINYLFQARRQLLDQALSREELAKLRKEIINRMVVSNMQLNQDMIIRHPDKGYLLDPTNASLSTIYRMHFKYATSAITSTPTNKLVADNTMLDRSASTSTVNTMASNMTNTSTHGLPASSVATETTTPSAAAAAAPQQPKGAKFYHLFFELKACVAHICQPGEFTELYFSLYSAVDGKFLTEQFVVVLNYNGMPKDESQIGKLQTLFVDLSLHDMTDDLYMVCHVVRLGGMKLGDGKDHFGSIGTHTSQFFHSNKHLHQSFQKPSANATSNTMCRRPFGCAVLKLSSLASLHNSDEKASMEHDMPVYAAISEANYTTLHEDIIANNTKEFQKNPRAESLRVSLRTFYGLLDEVLKTNAALLQDIPQTLRLGFADVAFPDDSRNDLYITLASGDLTQFGRSRNIQVTMCVRDNRTGQVIENAISVGAGARPVSYWESMVLYHEQRPTWGELIKINIEDVHQWEPSTDAPTQSSTSVVSATSGGGEKIIAMGFLPLFLPPLHRDFVADGSHTLNLYKYDRQSASNSVTDVSSAALQQQQQQQQNSSSSSNNKQLVLLRDTITLNTFLCSNKFTQNKVLVKLLNWRALMEGGGTLEEGTVELLSVLDQFTFVGEVEVVKFLRDIFDALLDILAYEDDEISDLVIREIHDQVLAAIVWLLGIVQDRRFSNFRPVLDVYIQHRFSIQDYERHLMKSLSRLCSDPSNASKAKLLRSSMKVWDYLFRFIVRSRLNQQQKEHEEERAANDETFKRELDELLHKITSIMSPEHPSSMIGTQTLALQHFADILVELHRIFSPQQVLDVAVHFVDACAHVTGRLVGFKLAMILGIVKGPTFEYPSCRLEMAKHVIRWIRLWLNSYMATAKDVIFARQVEQQHPDSSNTQQTRLPRSQWIENLRLSTTILSELLDKVRNNYSRPTSFAATNDDDAFAQECSVTDVSQITEHALQLVPQLLNAYKDIQRLTVQAMHVSSAPPALATSPATPFPSTYPFQPAAKTSHTVGGQGLTSDQAAMISTGLLDLTVVILELFYMTPRQQWTTFIKKMQAQDGIEDTAEFLRKIVYTCMGILRRIPRKWLNFDAIAHQIILCDILEPIKSIFELPAFIPTEKANVAKQRSTLLLWRIFYVGFLRVVGSPRLELSESMPQVQRAVWKITGNMRGEVGAKVFLALWKLAGKSASCTAAGFGTLNDYDVTANKPPLTDYFGSDLLTLHDRVRVNALSIIADIIAIELYSYGELLHVQHVVISTLDRLVMSENKGNEIINARITVELNAALEQRLLADNRQDCLVVGTRAVESLCKFHGLLLQIRSLPSDDDEFMDERITATLKLMKFIQVIEREEIYIKYVHQLVQLHLDSRNFIEAALTLRFHADLLQWDPSDKLSDIPDLSLPVQSSFARKEGLYMKMITYLDQGNAWEICVQLCKELAYEYENTLYDYVKLSDILQRQATFAENIVKKERCFTEYFRVGFYGRGFPASNRNRQYIYRGLEWEKMSSFVERMQNRHPNAQLLPSKISNSMSITDDQLKELDSALDGQYLQITPVTPIPDTDDIPCLSNPNAPDSIKKYYAFNNVSKFSFSKPVTRESTDKTGGDNDKQAPESDFLNLWTEKCDFECEDKFPTIVRRSKIVSSQTSVISPIENAVTAMENKNKELESLEKKYAAHLPKTGRRMSSLAPPVNINPFSMSLNGAVDAPVNGGVPLYKKAFLSKEYWDKNPEMRQWIYRLQNAIQDQVLIIKKCLETHNKLVSNEMRPFHTTLTEFFNKNFAEEIKSL